MSALAKHLRDTVPNSAGPDLYDREWERIAAAAEAFVREQIARDIEAEYDALAKDPEDSFWAGYRGATETAARITRGGAA